MDHDVSDHATIAIEGEDDIRAPISGGKTPQSVFAELLDLDSTF